MTGDDDLRAGQGREPGDPPRLTEESGVDPWLAGLIRSTGPYKSPPGRKQRVLLSLGRANASRRAPLVLRPAIVAGVLIGCAAFASAAIGPWRGWVGRAYDRLASSSERIAAATGPARMHRLAAGHALAVAVPAADRSPSSVPAPSSVDPIDNRDTAPSHVPRAAPRSSGRTEARREIGRRETATQESAPPDREDRETQAVLAGMRALRLDHDPVRARALLAAYLERHPNGALAEEALALTIEAAVAHHDGDASALGARYLRRYPAGPFRALALRAQH